jgi:hypothetical protein
LTHEAAFLHERTFKTAGLNSSVTVTVVTRGESLTEIGTV